MKVDQRALQSQLKREEIRSAVDEAVNAFRFAPRYTFERKTRQRKVKPKKLIAYDLETERIAKGTPRPLYITAYGAGFALESRIRDMAHLTAILRTQFLTEENIGVAFVAWNGNRFDAYFIAAALVREGDLVIKPYMTKSKALRGFRVLRAEDLNAKNPPCWEFLDGIAMTGLVGLKLEKFVANFAPNFPKLVDAIDFEREGFNPDNPVHCAYAMRDSEALYHAISRAQQIMMETFDSPLGVTMGGVCIKIFQSHIPRDVRVQPLTPDLLDIVNRYVMRGGFCYCVKRYHGPIWKYDINQAYAAAMRDAKLPEGGALHLRTKPPSGASVYIARVTATNPKNKIPFYCRVNNGDRIATVFALKEIPETWLTSIELEQLSAEGWRIDFQESWVWPGQGFSMSEYVDKLERLRTTCEGGPSGPIGTMVKATGNHSYGKTVEIIEPIEYLIAKECPDDCLPFYGDGSDPIEHVYYRIDSERKPKAYHQPHLGAWITAHVRMVLRRGALVAPDAWLYADTDCLVFSRDVTALLDIDAKRYGAFKIEEEGAIYRIIAKKVYARDDEESSKRSAKGLNVRKLTPKDFEEWYDGNVPVQKQIQINNFLAVTRGAEMYREQVRRGTAVDITSEMV